MSRPIQALGGLRGKRRALLLEELDEASRTTTILG
ncbi:Uncharacterised protein [Pseudomonas aeruginosa]|nr:Uncharacterised protein [Pseudomonas aeruginosa]VTM12166.1 Uncharacterised protein [Pseudomonas aeruginosa]